MNRREFIGTVAGAALACGPLGAAAAAGPAAGGLVPKVRPGDPGWPTPDAWAQLAEAVGGRLQRVSSPLSPCLSGGEGPACDAAVEALANPFFIQDQPGATQSSGWLDGWTSAPSAWCAVPRSAADVARLVDFARHHHLRLVVRGGAHSYLGQSNAADSLMIWTRDLDGLAWHDAFVPRGGEGRTAPAQAVTIGSGARFFQVYDFVTGRHGRYLQGGGCVTVGVGGHLQTGGFGSFSKYGGLTAGRLLEAEIVTADGTVRTVNDWRDPDLFFALKGGGAGFGVTTRLTVATDPLPERFGALTRTLRARDRESFRRLVAAVVETCEDLMSPHWGEQIAFEPDLVVKLSLVFQGLTERQARDGVARLDAFVAGNGDALAEASPLRVVSMPATGWWDSDYRQRHFPKSIVTDDRPGAPPGQFWWAGNAVEVSLFIAGYDSVWLPRDLLAPARREALVSALVDASRASGVTLHLNKGLSGASEARRAEARNSALHPSAVDAFALAIVAGGQTGRFPGVPGHEPDYAAARRDRAGIDAAAARMKALAPDAGSYSSEMSYFAPDWRERAWGPNYPRLLDAKRTYDPTGVFTGWHQVGSEFWSPDGFTPA